LVPTRSLVADPVNAGVWYVGADSGLWRSTNGGAAWEFVSAINPNGFEPPGVSSIAIDPQNPARILVGSACFSRFIPCGLYETKDGGITWSIVFFRPAAVFGFLPDASAVYAGLYYVPPGSDILILKSVDEGATWLSIPVAANVNAIEVDPKTPSIVYAGTGAGVSRSEDGGATWTPINEGLTNLVVTSIAIDAQNTENLFAATYGGGVFESTDGGMTWTALNAGLADLNVNRLMLDRNGTLYAGTQSRGVFVYPTRARQLVLPIRRRPSPRILAPRRSD
jgi:photosystem II stability/assembly factor-like uncharacterized protein